MLKPDLELSILGRGCWSFGGGITGEAKTTKTLTNVVHECRKSRY